MNREDPPGRIATFYSYKGGTGRSMALANFAWMLAAGGKRVLVVDWDLEAPGLHRYFRPFLIDPELSETDGLIDAFWGLASDALQRLADSKEAHQTPIDMGMALSDVTRRLEYDAFPATGYIDFIGAGRQCETYSERVNTFDWKRFYELGGAQMFVQAKAYWRPLYDWILIDSRTGVSDTSGICTIQLPDLIVGCFTMNRQSIEGVAAVLRSIRSFRSPTVDGSKIELCPLATRIENNEQRRLERARAYARSVMASFLTAERGRADGRTYWDRMELAYRPGYAFEEILAAFNDATGAEGAADTMAAQVELMSRCISGDDTLRVPEVLAEDRHQVLAQYMLGAMAEGPNVRSESGDADQTETQFVRGLFAKEQRWRTGQFRWRDLASRRELDLLTDAERASFGRTMSYYLTQSERAQEFMQQLDARLFAMIGSVAAIIMGVLAIPILPSLSDGPLEKLWVIARDQPIPLLLILLCFGAVASAALLVQSPKRPYGMRLAQILVLMMMGPLRPEIPDYQVEAKG